MPRALGSSLSMAFKAAICLKACGRQWAKQDFFFVFRAAARQPVVDANAAVGQGLVQLLEAPKLGTSTSSISWPRRCSRRFIRVTTNRMATARRCASRAHAPRDIPTPLHRHGRFSRRRCRSRSARTTQGVVRGQRDLCGQVGAPAQFKGRQGFRNGLGWPVMTVSQGTSPVQAPSSPPPHGCTSARPGCTTP